MDPELTKDLLREFAVFFEQRRAVPSAAQGDQTSPATAISSDRSSQRGTSSSAAAACASDALEAPNAQFTAEEYLSTSKESSPAKKKFRYVLRMAARQAKVWGVKTLKELSMGELHHIHTEVCTNIPVLKNKMMEVDKILSHCLTEAKYYRKRKAGEQGYRIARHSKHPKKGTKQGKGKERAQSKDTSSDDDDEEEEGLRAAHKHPKDMKHGKGKERAQSKDTSSDDDDDEEEEEEESYMQKIAARKLVNRAILDSIKDRSKAAAKFNTGDEVVLVHKGEEVATGTFLCSVNEMYCQIAFEQYLSEDNPDYPIELPSPLPPSPQLGRKGKDYLSELQENDIFLWKHEKMKSNKPVRGFCYGKVNQPKEPQVSGKRPIKPTHKCMQPH